MAAYAIKTRGTMAPQRKRSGGSSGAVISCGLLVFQGQVICDGLVSFALAGAKLPTNFKEQLAACRAQGALYRDRLLPRIPP